MEISVIIPTYNREYTIVRAIESVLEQTYPVSEIIVVDDGSADNTGGIVTEMNDERIRYIKQDENRGAAAARNKGASLARFPMIAFHDSDDEWRPDKIEKQVAYMKGHGEYRLVYTAYVRHMDSAEYIVPEIDGDLKLEGSILPEILFQNTVGTCTVLMEKDLFDSIGGFDESLRSLEDWDMIIRAARATGFGFVPEPLVDAAFLPDGITADMGAYYQARCYMLRKYKDEYLSTGTFDKTIEDILSRANKDKVFEQVKNLMLNYMS